MLNCYPLLTEQECIVIRTQLAGLRSAWISRATGFFTVGAASYIDVCQSTDPERDYYGRAPRLNELLQGTFRSLYERLQQLVEIRTGTPARMATEWAIPGFHIFLGDAINVAAREGAHVDRQYLRLSPESAATPVQSLSFTLPLGLPQVGGGLQIWPDRSQDDCSPLLDEDGRFCRYDLGVMVVHDGEILHRIARVPGIQPNDVRITLQGHGLLTRNNEWILYW